MLTQIIDPEFIYGAKTQELVISFYHLDVIPGFYALTKEDLVLIDVYKTIQLVIPIADWEEKSGVKIADLIELGKVTVVDYKEEGSLLLEKDYDIKSLKKFNQKISL